jgi:hypothetical protein
VGYPLDVEALVDIRDDSFWWFKARVRFGRRSLGGSPGLGFLLVGCTFRGFHSFRGSWVVARARGSA